MYENQCIFAGAHGKSPHVRIQAAQARLTPVSRDAPRSSTRIRGADSPPDRHQYDPTHRLGSIMKAPTVGEGAVRVLGVDPGLTRCGLGVVDHTPGRPLTMTAAGVVRTPADADIGHRLLLIERGVERWLDEYRPELVVVERVFSQHNVRTVMGTAQASTVAILCAARRGLPVTRHTPSEVK